MDSDFIEKSVIFKALTCPYIEALDMKHESPFNLSTNCTVIVGKYSNIPVAEVL